MSVQRTHLLPVQRAQVQRVQRVLLPRVRRVSSSYGSESMSASRSSSVSTFFTTLSLSDGSSTSIFETTTTMSSIPFSTTSASTIESRTMSSSQFSTTASTYTTSLSTQAPNPIKHVIVIMQENRAFDNYFWTWPGQIGYNPNLCMSENPGSPSSSCLTPTLDVNPVTANDLPHDWTSSWASYNNGAMNGFLKAASDDPNVMDYYDNSTIPNLWSYAAHYVLADDFFTSVKSYSQPNHWYMIAANSPLISLTASNTQQQASCYNSLTATVTLSTCTYINQVSRFPQWLTS